MEIGSVAIDTIQHWTHGILYPVFSGYYITHTWISFVKDPPRIPAPVQDGLIHKDEFALALFKAQNQSNLFVEQVGWCLLTLCIALPGPPLCCTRLVFCMEHADAAQHCTAGPAALIHLQHPAIYPLGQAAAFQEFCGQLENLADVANMHVANCHILLEVSSSKCI